MIPRLDLDPPDRVKSWLRSTFLGVAILHVSTVAAPGRSPILLLVR